MAGFLICIFLAACIIAVMVTVVSSQYKENETDHFDFFEYVFHKPRTLLTDVLSKLIVVAAVFLAIVLIVIGMAFVN